MALYPRPRQSVTAHSLRCGVPGTCQTNRTPACHTRRRPDRRRRGGRRSALRTLRQIQSRKTRAFIGAIALAFDHDFDVTVVLTKGTDSPARQTIKRIKGDFGAFIERDAVQVFDIMALYINALPSVFSASN